jgi:hypothetical protein
MFRIVCLVVSRWNVAGIYLAYYFAGRFGCVIKIWRVRLYPLNMGSEAHQ